MADDFIRLVPKPEPMLAASEDVIRHLEGLLAKAKAGEFNGIMTATVAIDGRGACAWTGTGWAGAVRDAVHTSIGIVDILRERMLRELIEWDR